MDKQDKIERYIGGSLSEEESTAFERELKTNAQLQSEVEATHMAFIATERLQQEEMLKQFKAWDTEAIELKKPKSFPWIWFGILAVLIAVALFYFYEKKGKNVETIPETTIFEEKTKPKRETREKAVPTQPAPNHPEHVEKTVPLPTRKVERPESKSNKNRPIAALLSSEQRTLLRDEIPLDRTSSLRGSKQTKSEKYPNYGRVEEARKLLIKNKIPEAMGLLRQVPSDDIYWPKSQMLLGHAFLAQNDCKAAIRAFQNCLLRKPKDKQAVAGLGLAEGCNVYGEHR